VRHPIPPTTESDTSPRPFWQSFLFLALFGLVLFLLTWQKMVVGSFRFAPPTLLADGVLALLVAWLLTARWGGNTAVSQLLRPLYQWRVAPQWYAFALFLFPVIAYGTILFRHGGGDSLVAFLMEPLGVVSWLELGLLIFLSALVGGPLGEEIGWRGFALPRLTKLYDETVSSLILGGVWALWHVPLYLTGVYHGRVDDILARFFWTIPLTFLFTYLHRQSHGSLLLVILLHTSFNVSPFSLHPINILILLLLARWVQQRL
jgi:membrane protease YdiL (CAAX protease family)